MGDQLCCGDPSVARPDRRATAIRKEDDDDQTTETWQLACWVVPFIWAATPAWCNGEKPHPAANVISAQRANEMTGIRAGGVD